MAQWLRQSTATTVLVGPLVDSVDATQETGLTITSGEVLLWKEGGTSLVAKNEASSATHRGYGHYTVPLDATDTNTAGQFTVAVYEAGIMVARERYMVAKTEPWDAYFSTSTADRLPVNMVKINGTASYAANLAMSASVIIRGTVTNSGHSPTTTAFKASDITEATDDHFIGRVVIFTSGVLLYQATNITDYVGSTSVYTVATMTEAPTSGDTFVIV